MGYEHTLIVGNEWSWSRDRHGMGVQTIATFDLSTMFQATTFDEYLQKRRQDWSRAVTVAQQVPYWVFDGPVGLSDGVGNHRTDRDPYHDLLVPLAIDRTLEALREVEGVYRLVPPFIAMLERFMLDSERWSDQEQLVLLHYGH